MFCYKKRFTVIFFIILNLVSRLGESGLNATTLKEAEFATASARGAAVAFAHIAEAAVDKTRMHHFIILVADAVRLANETLSIINSNWQYDYPIYDCLWSVYDAKNFVQHFKNLLKNEKHSEIVKRKTVKNETLEESKKFKALSIKIKNLVESFIVGYLHILALPGIEGFAAMGVAFCDGNNIEVKRLKNGLRALCSISRLFDNLMMSEQKSPELLAYTILLIANIVIALNIDFNINERIGEEQRQREERRQRQRDEEEQRRRNEEAQRHEEAQRQWEEWCQRRRNEEEQRQREERRQRQRDEEEQRKRQEEWDRRFRERFFGGGRRGVVPELRDGMTTAQARDVLGVAPGASDTEISKAYRLRALETHPDKHAGREDDFRRVQEAYEKLVPKPKVALVD